MLFGNGEAVISECGHYRYWLTRRWGSGGPLLPFCMLNPSTADATKDDPTIRRCISFAKREGASGLVVVNLYAFRATNPSRLAEALDPVGPENWQYLEKAGNVADVVCAWGSQGLCPPHVVRVINFLKEREVGLLCLGTTMGGSPRHPLYVKSDQPLIPWSV